MFRKYSKTMVLLSVLVISTHCKQSEKESYTKDKSGLEYKFFVLNESAKKAEINDIMELKYKLTSQNDSLIEETNLFRMRLKAPTHPNGSIEDGLAMMHVGDSALFLIDAELYYTITRGISLPKNIKKGEKIKFYIKLQDILDMKDFEAYQKRMYHRSREQEMQLLEDYLKRTNITVEPDNSGLYFIEMEKGNGRQPTPGQKVSVQYSGYFIDGNLFSTTYHNQQPFTFIYGNGEVIAGWEEGIGRMQVGGKYKLIIPSYLAYGDEGRGELILPFSTLVFEIELLGIK